MEGAWDEREQNREIEILKIHFLLLFSYAKQIIPQIQTVLLSFYLLNILCFVPLETMVRVKGSGSD